MWRYLAVYLSGVCADSPLVLRGCAQGETGIVLSRYDGINGYDWAAIPQGNRSLTSMPSIGQEGIPLFADAKIVTFLRDRYRRQHLRGIASDKADGGIAVRNWYELVSSSSDRASYGFESETSPEQDAALIRAYNSSPVRQGEGERALTTNSL